MALGFSLYANMFNVYSPDYGKKEMIDFVDNESTKVANKIKDKESYVTYDDKFKVCLDNVKSTEKSLSKKEQEILSHFCARKI